MDCDWTIAQKLFLTDVTVLRHGLQQEVLAVVNRLVPP